MITEKLVCGKRKRDYTYLTVFLTYKNPDGNICNPKAFTKWVGDGTQTEIDNNPKEGFKIIRTVGGGSGDIRQAYVEIEDPDGFHVEITDENFIYICKHYGVIKGVIQGKYVYGFTNHRIHLVNIEDSAYTIEKTEWENEKLLNNKKQAAEKFSMYDLKIGYVYSLMNSLNKKAIYLGKAKTNKPVYDYNSDTYTYFNKEQNSHIFLMMVNGTTDVYSILTAKQIMGEECKLLDESICKELTDELTTYKLAYNELYYLGGKVKDDSILKKYLKCKLT